MAGTTGKHSYEDIINLPRHVSPTRPRMSMSERAAQFALIQFDLPASCPRGFMDGVLETGERRKRTELRRPFAHGHTGPGT